ncbi:MAG: tetratricopeptide repeat protein, partial [Bdellovibrionales bacterium]|nr:tetratricopeptide repeat protein [Bdellovibrionales bacterium]
MAKCVKTLPKCTILGVLVLQLASCAGPRTKGVEEVAVTPGTSPGTPVLPLESTLKPLHKESSAEYHYSLAQAYSVEGQIDRAIEEYRLTLVYDPGSAWVHTRLAAEWVRKGDVAQALESAKKAIELDPQLIDARMILAGIYSVTRQNDLASQQYDQVLKIDSGHEEAFVFKSQVQFEQGKVLQSIATLRELLKKNPESHLGWYYLARSARTLDRFKEAVTAYRRAIDIKAGFA